MDWDVKATTNIYSAGLTAETAQTGPLGRASLQNCLRMRPDRAMFTERDCSPCATVQNFPTLSSAPRPQAISCVSEWIEADTLDNCPATEMLWPVLPDETGYYGAREALLW